MQPNPGLAYSAIQPGLFAWLTRKESAEDRTGNCRSKRI